MVWAFLNFKCQSFPEICLKNIFKMLKMSLLSIKKVIIEIIWSKRYIICPKKPRKYSNSYWVASTIQSWQLFIATQRKLYWLQWLSSPPLHFIKEKKLVWHLNNLENFRLLLTFIESRWERRSLLHTFGLGHIN